MPSLIFQVVSWPTLVIALLVFGFAPGVVLRLIAFAFPRDDPRRRELRGELYAVPRIERPFWVFEQLEVGLCEGLPRRFARAMARGHGMSPEPAWAYYGVGEVIAQLRGEFPDVRISKIRFLESEGLIELGRTPDGYLRFSRQDVERLQYILTAQRDHYLPLRVIKEQLDLTGRHTGPSAPLG